MFKPDLRAFTYKPHTTFDFVVRPEWNFDAQLSIIRLVHPSEAPHKPRIPVLLHHRVMYEDCQKEEQFVHLLQYLIEEFERHEIHEWFKYNGQHVVKPHG